ncbi:Gfo/Idh/MocA family oxidoreductase [soil metagenome]
MDARTVGVILNGVTGRMGSNQHLIRSILAIREQGGVQRGDAAPIWPEPILVGRNQAKLARLAAEHGLERWTTNLDEALASDAEVYFDAQLTPLRAAAVRAALEAGKHTYCEKPIAPDLATALDLTRRARAAGVVHGVVQDKLFLPGLRKLRRLIDGGVLGRLLSVRGEFGYWVFEGDWQPAQRPSWNYRSEDGGGIVVDMFCHWRYVLDQLFGDVRSVTCVAATHIPERTDEGGERYAASADDAAYAIFELDGGVIAQINSSWAVRVHRDELVELQVDGTEASAVAGLRDCVLQHRGQTPAPRWNPDLPAEHDFRAQWSQVPDNQQFDNGFKVQWEAYLRAVVDGAPFPWDFLEAAKGVQLAQLGLQAWREGRRVAVEPLEV